MENFEKWRLLARVDSPARLRELSERELEALAAEIREYLVYRVGENGGHLASNLGVVELTLALHRVFDSPRDHILFDVGHQSYVHKLITGRGAAFDTLRCPGGISGFTKRAESPHDAFGAGHSSTAISAGLGLSEADAQAGLAHWTVAVVGDGALSGGLAYEGLNNCRPGRRLLIIINENEMSISKNTGRLAEHLQHVRTSRGYINTKRVTSAVLRHIPLLGPPLYHLFWHIKRRVKHLFYHENLFEHMGIDYVGPVDGHDIAGLEAILSRIKGKSDPVILHVKTQKGKGYAPAEQDAGRYHALSPAGAQREGVRFSAAFGAALCERAMHDPHILAVTAAMQEGTGLSPFAAQYPKRFFDVGIAEGHAITFAAGLAAGGARPVVALYSTFLPRALDHLLHDVALQGLPLVLALDRAGLNHTDGATHHGILDVAMLSALPHVRILAPVTPKGVARALEDALAFEGVAALRYPAGTAEPALLSAFYGDGEEGATSVRVFDAAEQPVLTVVTHGRIAAEAVCAARALADAGIAVRVLLCEYLAPYGALAAEVAPLLAGNLLLLEEELGSGGFGEHLRAALEAQGALARRHVVLLATQNAFLTPAPGQTLYDAAGIDAKTIEKTLHDLLQEGE